MYIIGNDPMMKLVNMVFIGLMWIAAKHLMR